MKKESYEDHKTNIWKGRFFICVCIALILTLTYPIIIADGLYIVITDWNFSSIFWIVLVGLWTGICVIIIIVFTEKIIKEKRKIEKYIENLEKQLKNEIEIKNDRAE